MFSKYVLDLPHRRLWLLMNIEFVDSDTYTRWCRKLYDRGMDRRKAARLIERASKIISI